MIDLTSSLYLGYGHPSAALAAWRDLTTGAPAALVEPPGSAQVARQLAASIGGAEGVLLPSTLHLFVDLFVHGLPNAALFWDAALYPVAAIGIELARGRGTPTLPFEHLGPDLDSAWLRRHTPAGHYPVIVTDGYCVGCGRAAPLARYARAVDPLGGLVVLDDTQALGLLGANPTPRDPFGSGGGGSVRHQALRGERWLVCASLAKSYGVPIACLVGPRSWLAGFVERSAVRVHCSPPSQPAIAAARRALELEPRGAARRRRALARQIDTLHAALSRRGVRARGGLFPVQSVAASDVGGSAALVRVQAALTARGVRTTVCQARCSGESVLTLVLRADHAPSQIEHVARELVRALASAERGAEARPAALRASIAGWR